MRPDPSKWYFKTYVFVAAFLCIGPFALPLVWANPRYDVGKKALITIITLVAGYLMFIMFAKSVESIYNYYSQLLQLAK